MIHSFIVQEDRYRGYPLSPSIYGYYSIILDKSIDRLESMLEDHSQVLIIRFNVRYPAGYPADNSNDRFIHFLKHYNQYLHRHKLHFHYVWIREKNISDSPHYHLLYLFNGNQIRRFNHFRKPNDLWSNSLGLTEPNPTYVQGYGFDGPNHYGLMLKRGDVHNIHDAFHDYICYLAKVYSKDNNCLPRYGNNFNCSYLSKYVL